ncbi:hypothetical protein GGX14DRAFT_573595 [Mycena pura]|uniref:Uncharacterized protein n=1 Tax=Mycena pura TaxID=153505 RepID=A0AAD6Y2S3_9AGAR|nr:hypothetical protein GGX14DRAFT_573595 [Mycena pura]
MTPDAQDGVVGGLSRRGKSDFCSPSARLAPRAPAAARVTGAGSTSISRRRTHPPSAARRLPLGARQLPTRYPLPAAHCKRPPPVALLSARFPLPASRSPRHIGDPLSSACRSSVAHRCPFPAVHSSFLYLTICTPLSSIPRLSIILDCRLALMIQSVSPPFHPQTEHPSSRAPRAYYLLRRVQLCLTLASYSSARSRKPPYRTLRAPSRAQLNTHVLNLPTAAACRALWMLAGFEARPTVYVDNSSLRVEHGHWADAEWTCGSVLCAIYLRPSGRLSVGKNLLVASTRLMLLNNGSIDTMWNQLPKPDAPAASHLHRLFGYADVDGSCEESNVVAA